MKDTKRRSNCEEEENEGGPFGGLRQRIWEKQLIEKREIYLNTEVNDSVIELIVAQIQNFNDYDNTLEGMPGFVREPIKLFLNTNGGEIYSALAVCSAIEASVTPVHTIALGKAISAGFLILICGDVRFAQNYATLLHHTGSGGATGVITDIIEEAEALENLNAKIHGMIRKHTRISDEQLDEVFYRKNNWYIEIEEALNLGVIDGIWPPEVYGIPEDPEDPEDYYEGEDDYEGPEDEEEDGPCDCENCTCDSERTN